jgi:hypothetical protein
MVPSLGKLAGVPARINNMGHNDNKSSGREAVESAVGDREMTSEWKEALACWEAAERRQIEAQRNWARAAAISDRTTRWIRILFWFGILPCGVFSFVTMIFIILLMRFPELATWIMSF